jgi:hypothetical protein
MGKFVLTDAVINIDGTDLSNHASSVSIDMPDDEVDLTGFGAKFKETGKGLSDATITVNFFQDFSASQVDAVLWPLKTSHEPFTVAVKATSAPASATNPQYVMEAQMFGYSPIAGSVGEASTTEVTFKNTSQEGVKKITSSGEEVS